MAGQGEQATFNATVLGRGARSGIAPAVVGLGLFAIGGVLAASAILGGVAAAGAIARGRGPIETDAVYIMCIAAPQILVALIAARVMDVRLLRVEHGIAAAALGWASLGSGGVTLAAGLAGAVGGMTRMGGSAGPALLAGVPLILLQSTAEEMYLRGWLQPALARYWRGWIAIGAVAILFALLHLIGGPRAPLALVNLALGGVLFGVLAVRGGGLALPIAAHAGWNIGEQLLIGVDPNPGVGAFGAIVDLDLPGPSWWGGSAEGLNASVTMTLVLLVLLGIARYRRAMKPKDISCAAA